MRTHQHFSIFKVKQILIFPRHDLDIILWNAIYLFFQEEEIHQKFQLIKEQRLSAASKIQADNKWYLEKDISIDIKNTTFLGEYRGLEYWGALSDKFQIKWSEHQSAFLAALEKGFVHRNQGQNGIKVLSGKVFEIKINDDLRAFTNKAYYNKNHKVVKKFANKNKLFFVAATL